MSSVGSAYLSAPAVRLQDNTVIFGPTLPNHLCIYDAAEAAFNSVDVVFAVTLGLITLSSIAMLSKRSPSQSHRRSLKKSGFGFHVIL